MKYAREFILPLAGLPLGETRYTFDLGLPFFELHADEELCDAAVQVDLRLTKHENMTELVFSMKGWMELACDRCADNYRQAVEGTERLILKNGDHFEEESDEIILVPADLHEFDISQLLYEYLILLLPYKRVHPDNEDGSPGCNPEVLERLRQMEAPHTTDPRWDALKNLGNLS